MPEVNIFIKKSCPASGISLRLPGSKSETNRLLLLQAIYPEINIENISESDDSVAMRDALSSTDEVINIGHAGTAMRFLTAYFAATEGRIVTLTGSPRMCLRPIQPLVDALKMMGAKIEYVENAGFPPLRIYGRQLTGRKISVDSSMSSQFVSALILIAPLIKSGLELQLCGVTSAPYIKMSLRLLSAIGIESEFLSDIIKIRPAPDRISSGPIQVESDWSAASYFYSIVALSPVGFRIELNTFKKDSLQGDAVLAGLYESFGVETSFEKSKIILSKISDGAAAVDFDLSNTPDIAQTIAVTCAGLGIGCNLTGLHTLRIKETDRIAALQNELQKLGCQVAASADSITLLPGQNLHENRKIATYEDHRMAMAFAPLAVRIPIEIQNAGVVSKSYPSYWDSLRRLGFAIS